MSLTLLRDAARALPHTLARGEWRATLRRAAWPLHRRLGRFGPAAVLVLALAMAFAAWHAMRRPAIDASILKLEQQARELQQLRPRLDAATAQQTLRALPPMRQHPADLRAVFEVADLHRVELANGEYQLRALAESSWVTVSATFPLTAGYPEVKAFTRSVLERLPHVALDDLRLERSHIGSRELQVRVRLSFHYQRAEP
ncbi:MAG: hypothetical protein JNL85_11960 [Rubrivivax sp.]|nr:hypothetical protein [Rubrivivax sp.]